MGEGGGTPPPSRRPCTATRLVAAGQDGHRGHRPRATQVMSKAQAGVAHLQAIGPSLQLRG
jgi:hypothetical protein